MEEQQIGWLWLSDAEREKLVGALRSILSRHPEVVSAYLYGSAVHSGRPARDVDLGLVLKEEADPADCLAKVHAELNTDTLLARSPLDVRILNRGGPVFLNNVLKDGERIYESDRAQRIEFEARAMSQWLDFRPVWEATRKTVLTRWANE